MLSCQWQCHTKASSHTIGKHQQLKPTKSTMNLDSDAHSKIQSLFKAHL